MTQVEKAPRRSASDSATVSSAPLDIRRIRSLLGRSPHSSTLPGEFLDRLARLGRVERFKGGELIHAAWQPVHKLWAVLSGGLRVTELGDDGSAHTTTVLGEGSYYSAGSLVAEGEVVTSEAHVIGRTQLATFDLSRLEHEFAGDEQIMLHRLRLLHRRLLTVIELAGHVLSVPLPQRMARRLLSQALSAGRGPEIELWVSQGDLAAMLGASRSKVNAELGRLEASGALRRGYRKIVVCDLALLRAAAGADVMPL